MSKRLCVSCAIAVEAFLAGRDYDIVEFVINRLADFVLHFLDSSFGSSFPGRGELLVDDYCPGDSGDDASEPLVVGLNVMLTARDFPMFAGPYP